MGFIESGGCGTDAEIFGATLSELQCPTASFNTDCASYTHYNNWGTTNTAGPPIQYKWNYGTTQQLQGLTFGDGVTYRDGNADGILD